MADNLFRSFHEPVISSHVECTGLECQRYLVCTLMGDLVNSRKRLTVGALVAVVVSVAAGPTVHAEPLTPLTPGELQYLDQLRQVFAAKHDPSAFRSDGELLTMGQFVCDKRGAGQVGAEATFQSPAITQLALIYLCP